MSTWITISLEPIPSLTSQEDYRTNAAVYDQILELAARSLDAACYQGVRLMSGQRLHAIPIGHKGDWAYLVPWQQLQVYCLRYKKQYIPCIYIRKWRNPYTLPPELYKPINDVALHGFVN